MRKRKQKLSPIAVVDLDDRDMRNLGRRHPELRDHGAVLAVAVPADVQPALSKLLHEIVDANTTGRQRRMEQLVDLLSEAMATPGADLLADARNEAKLRERVIRDFGALRSSDIAEMRGSSASNRQIAYRLRRDGKIFSVPHGGRSWFLGFQFDQEGYPHPVVADVLEILPGWQPWDLARWFVTGNRLLDDRPPVEFLVSDPDGVRNAAIREAANPLLKLRPNPAVS